mmetsp:Transcript_12432/g.31868  ORF Transcript_12432/g.31868 Transcript_12432/m.31868 type:complete len:267 (-) Transcript_12432:265-1065(-)
MGQARGIPRCAGAPARAAACASFGELSHRGAHAAARLGGGGHHPKVALEPDDAAGAHAVPARRGAEADAAGVQLLLAALRLHHQRRLAAHGAHQRHQAQVLAEVELGGVGGVHLGVHVARQHLVPEVAVQVAVVEEHRVTGHVGVAAVSAKVVVGDVAQAGVLDTLRIEAEHPVGLAHPRAVQAPHRLLLHDHVVVHPQHRLRRYLAGDAQAVVHAVVREGLEDELALEGRHVERHVRAVQEQEDVAHDWHGHVALQALVQQLHAL